MCAQSLRDASRERPSPLSEAPLQRCARAPPHPQHKGQGHGMGSGLSVHTAGTVGRLWVVGGSDASVVHSLTYRLQSATGTVLLHFKLIL